MRWQRVSIATASFMQFVRSKFVRLELWLVLAVAALVLQLFPGSVGDLVALVDIRYWPRAAWLCLNVAVLMLLVAIRSSPGFTAEWRERRQRLNRERETAKKSQELREQREALQRVKNARRRRIY